MTDADAGHPLADERSAKDHVDESCAVCIEAAELAEHLRDSDPRHTREEQLELLIELIDDAHESALAASVGLEE